MLMCFAYVNQSKAQDIWVRGGFPMTTSPQDNLPKVNTYAKNTMETAAEDNNVFKMLNDLPPTMALTTPCVFQRKHCGTSCNLSVVGVECSRRR